MPSPDGTIGVMVLRCSDGRVDPKGLGSRMCDTSPILIEGAGQAAARSFAVVLLFGVVTASFVLCLTRLLPLTGGAAYMDLNFGYLPSDLLAFTGA